MQRAKSKGRPRQCCDKVANPIKPGSGQKYQEEVVLSTPTLGLVLSYNSTPVNQVPFDPYPFGNGWAFNYGMRVFLSYQDVAGVTRPDGRVLEFSPPTSGNVYIPEADISDTLEKLFDSSSVHTGWKYTVGGSETVELYDEVGKLISITQREGKTTTLTYSTASTPVSIARKPGLLIDVADHFGRSLALKYDFQSRVVSVTDPAGSEHKFLYDEASAVVLSGQPTGNNLTSIEFPGTERRVFHYNEQAHTAGANLRNALTGITDENNNRFSTYQYNSSAQAVSSAHAGGVNSYSITYNTDGTRTITDPLGTARSYSYQTLLGTARTTAISGPACPTCGPAAQTYDSNGFVASRTDWNGNLTTYTRADPSGRLDLETSRTEASGSGVARTITTQWHATFRLPTLITEPGRTTAFTHDANGNVLTRTVTDTVTSAARTWTYTWSTIGQLLSVDGPRTDVSDLTSYTYYADTDSDPGKRGNLATVTNPAGQVTSITAYDANGRPTTLVDPNGLTTTLAYHLRGWLISRQVGT
ncbi:MAG: DUF6531 domain-containing protein [Gammaproteobacteria bacterium]|nr:DUF6531 domain-containing protein [Gammaproteobacteria bacterium]